jgi:hypothetical protein
MFGLMRQHGAKCSWRLTVLVSMLMGCLIAFAAAPVPNTISWDKNRKLMSAEIKGMGLSNFLGRLTARTGWQIYVEPDTTATISAKFHDLPVGEALSRLLGRLSFALVPQTNAPAKLFVFRTSVGEATQLVKADRPMSLIPNELIVRLKPGQSIEELASSLGARVTGRSTNMNSFRLKFETDSAAEYAKEKLGANDAVALVDYNYMLERPDEMEMLLASSRAALNLRAQPVGDGNPVIVGLIDTAVPPIGNHYDQFLLEGLSVAGESPGGGVEPTHGQSMAETILNAIAKTLADNPSTSVRILPVDVYGPNDNTTTWEVAQGIQRAINEHKANIINLSLGGDGDSPFLRDIIEQASRQGVLIFAAPGNQPTTAPTYPAAYPEVVAITAGDPQGNVASYANRGDFIDGVGPGNAIISYNGQSFLISGTSVSTAYAAGVAAALAERSGKSKDEILALLRQIFPPPKK